MYVIELLIDDLRSKEQFIPILINMNLNTAGD